MKTYHEKIIDEIVQLIKDNLEIIYNYDEDALINIKNYCKEKEHKKYVPLTYDKLVYYTEEALGDIINTPYLYDFRPLE